MTSAKEIEIKDIIRTKFLFELNFDDLNTLKKVISEINAVTDSFKMTYSNWLFDIINVLQKEVDKHGS